MNNPQTILITGASGAIGGALARAYAAPGRSLALQGRNAERLAAVVRDCERLGAATERAVLDVRQADLLMGWVEDVAARTPVDLAIVTAGATSSTGAEREEPWADIERVLDVNLRAAMATVSALLPGMRRRGRGQIALVSSLSAWYGLPVTPAYCATKAGLKAYGEALRGALEPQGVAVSVVLPGFVKSAMSDAFPAPKPFMLTAEAAAARIRRGLARNQARISFPFPLNLGMWGLSLLPAAWSQRILRGLRYGP